MKISKSLKGLFLGLAVSGILFSGGVSVYPPAQCFAESSVEGPSQDTNDNAKQDQKNDEDKKNKQTPGQTNTSNSVNENLNIGKIQQDIGEIQQDIGKIQQNIRDKADGYVLYLAALALVMGLSGAGLAAWSLYQVSNENRSRTRSINELRKRCSELRLKYETLEDQYDKLRDEMFALDSRAQKYRKAAYEYEINNNAPIPSDNGSVASSKLPYGSPMVKPKQMSQNERLQQEESHIKSDYIALMKLWHSGDGTGYRRARAEFQEKYGVVEFSCVNAEQRMITNVKPIFKTVSSKGDFWAIASKVDKRLFMVYPSATLTYENQAHTTGGMKEVFVSNYRSGAQYSAGFSVDMSAYFVQDGDIWTNKKQGKLTFR